MCKCSGKCGCNITSTTKGEKGDASPVASLGYKVYTAILNQDSTADPIPIVLQNTLSAAIVWTRSSTGNYVGTLTSEFTANKTVIFINGYNSTVSNFQYETIAVWTDVNSIGVGTYKLTEQDSAGNLLKTTIDSVLYTTSIEIRVYP